MIKQNKIKQVLADGGIAVGTMFMEFATDGIGRIAANAGAEFGVFDMEHSAWTFETIKMLMGTTRASGMVPLVRPPSIDYHDLSRALDAGAMGLVTPLIESAEQARQVVESAKYPPVGRRGVACNLANDDYSSGSVVEKLEATNREQLIVIQIETVAGLENVDEIAAVEGVDVIWLGQFDLTASLGIAGQFDHPKFHDAVDAIREACDRHKVTPGYGSIFLDEIAKRRDEGFRFLVYTADIWIYQRALRQGIQSIRGSVQDEAQKNV